MDATLGYLLCCQSPALFLAALVLLVCYFGRRRSHRVRAVLDLVVCILCVAAGVALYFLGMGRGHFTIRDFYQIRTPGWVGMAVVGIVSLWAALRAFGAMNRRRTAEKAANRAANAETHRQAEEARQLEAQQREAQRLRQEQARMEQSAAVAQAAQTVSDALDTAAPETPDAVPGAASLPDPHQPITLTLEDSDSQGTGA